MFKICVTNTIDLIPVAPRHPVLSVGCFKGSNFLGRQFTSILWINF